MEELDRLVIQADEAGERLDKILSARFREIRSRTYFQSLIDRHLVLVNGEPVKKRMKPKEGDEVEVSFALVPEIGLSPEPIPLDILYEDEDLLVVNKPAGMVVHPAPGNWSGPFVNALLYHCHFLEGGAQRMRPGIVHRLDKDTSGVLVAAKNSRAHQELTSLFAAREVYKEYLAICLGNPGEVDINLPIKRHQAHRQKMSVAEGGRHASSSIYPLASSGKLSLVKVVIATGRTHQIRVHLSHLGSAVLGDSLYGKHCSNKRYNAARQLLHARILCFKHPVSKQMMEFNAPIPHDMSAVILQQFGRVENL